MNNPLAASWRRLRAATWARTLEFMRDKSAVGWNVVFPLLLVLGLGYMFSGPGQPLFKVAVLAPDTAALDAHLHPFLATPQVQFYREPLLALALHKVQLQRIDMLIDFTQSPARYWINAQSSKGSLLEQLMRGSAGPPLQRELANLIERLSIVCAGRTVEVRDLPPKYRPPVDWTLEVKTLELPPPAPADEDEQLTEEHALSVLEEVEL